tara:strand:+ start:251 stop:430 length:180 start_codon:yes stop_codon:yes gene_type:complete
MSQIPDGATRYHTPFHYKKGDFYAQYWVNGKWKESASMTNLKLMQTGVSINQVINARVK